MLVYLFELDSVRNTDYEIETGQQALFEEIVINGNCVVLSFNQLTDSKAFLASVSDKRTYENIVELFRMGVLKFSCYGNVRTASQYIQQAVEKCLEKGTNNFLFSGVPVKCTDRYMLEKIRDALRFANPEILEAEYEKAKGTEEAGRLEYLIRYVRMILVLSMESRASNPPKKGKTCTLSEFIERIIRICEAVEYKELADAFAILKDIRNEILSKEDDDTKRLLNNRTNWIEVMKGREKSLTLYLAEAVIDLCYNYTVEDSINGVARHYNINADEELRQDFLVRLKRYWNNREQGIHVFYTENRNKIQTARIKLPYWETAVRLLKEERGILNKRLEKGLGNSGEAGGENEELYERAWEKTRSLWKRRRALKMARRFGVAAMYILLFCAVQQIMGQIENRFFETIMNVRLNAIACTVIDILCFGILGSLVSEITGLPDILESVKNIGKGIKDMWRIRCAPKGVAYKRKYDK